MGVRTWIESWPVYRQLTGERSAGQRRGGDPRRTESCGPGPRPLTGREVDLPVLRGGLRAERLRQGRRGRPDRGRPRHPRQPRPALPEGLGDAPAHHRRRPPPRGPLPAPARRRTGSGWTWRPPWTWSRTASSRTRRESWQWEHEGLRANRTLGMATLGGATLDNEENYLIKKLFTALGVVQIENQARVCHSSTVAGLGTSFGRGGATTFLQDLQHSDCIVIEGSNFAEAHPVGFQWVMEAKARGATVIHVDPRFTRTSALADLHVPIRAGTDIAFLGGIINHVLSTGVGLPRVRPRLHQRRHHRRRRLPGHRGPRRRLLRPRRGHAPLRHRSWQYRDGGEVQAACRGRGRTHEDRERRRRAGRTHSRPGRVARVGRHAGSGRRPPARPRRCSTRGASTRSSSGTSPATPRRWSRRSAGCRARPFLEVCDALTSTTPAAERTTRVRVRGRLDPAHGRRAVHPRGVRSSSCCWATSAGPAAASRRCAATPSIQGSSDIPTLFNLLPGYIPMPHAHARRGPRRVRRGRAAPTRASGATCAPTSSACSRRTSGTPPPRTTTSASTTCPA